jgi:hypothetical protein
MEEKSGISENNKGNSEKVKKEKKRPKPEPVELDKLMYTNAVKVEKDTKKKDKNNSIKPEDKK